MSKSIDQLILTLNKESDIYAEVLELSKKKREAIKANALDELSEITTYEQGLVVTLFKLEEIREKVVDMVMRENHIETAENLTELTNSLSYEDRSKVLNAKDRLIVLVKNVTEENRFNNRVLEERLQLINLNIELMTQVGDDSGKYNRKAVSEDQEHKSIFDRRV
ncbi:flagellar protein FlgN [Fusibacter paucivorans]|uniref:Flagellar protein FlgN n=1 Tax=Fusibacter paucivorans TaxID=76009 RepID=A0ABS5PKW9_9FIRM|nr:flagellar protein FlgN [Fusibacter paucivorans]MBS7525794.1 flagellar protein FlgN [Fusibacter paucivorans]